MKPAPPVIRTLAIASSYGKIGEAHFSQIVGVVDVSPVENDGLLQKLLNRVKVRPAELVPFGDDEERVGAFEGIVVAPKITDAVAEDFLRLVHRLGVVRLNRGAGLEERFGDDDRRRVAHVVGSGLEREAPQREGFALERSEEHTLNSS